MQACPNCGYVNRPGVVFCENCGTSLIGSAAAVETRALGERATSRLDEQTVDKNILADEKHAPPTQGEAVFVKGGMIEISVGEGAEPMRLVVDKTITFGRRDAATGSVPDVDLTTFAGYRMGVSRRHSEIRLDSEGDYINLWDLGSSNGTFINGDRLISHRPYRLHDGDQIRFGQLAVNIHFIAPKDKEEKPSAAPAPKEEKPSAAPAPKEEKPSAAPAPKEEKPSAAPAPKEDEPSAAPAPKEEKTSAAPTKPKKPGGLA